MSEKMCADTIRISIFLFQEPCTISSEYPLRRQMPQTPYKEPKYSALLCLWTSPVPPTTTALVSQHSLVMSVSFTLLPSATNPSNALFLLPAMSENYVVFIEQPIKMDLLKIITGKMRGKALSEGIYWDPSLETVFHLVDKRTGEVRCY